MDIRTLKRGPATSTAATDHDPPTGNNSLSRDTENAGHSWVTLATAVWVVWLLVVKAVVATAFAVQLAILFLDVALRFFGGSYISWTLDFSKLSMAVIAFGGAVLAYENSGHVGLTLLSNRLSPEHARHLRVIQDLLILATTAILCNYSFLLVQQGWALRSDTLGWRQAWFILPIALGMGSISVRALSRVVMSSRASILVATTGVVVVTALGWVGRGFVSPDGAGGLSVVIVQIGLFALLMIIGLPIGFALALSALGYLYFSGDFGTPATVSINILAGVNSFVLLAIPFFVLVGLLMAESGLSRRLTDCLRIVVGRLPGGLLQVVVIASFVFSGLSGAKIADIVAVGTPLKKSLREGGYRMDESAAVLSAAAAGGESVPPSIAMIVLGSVASVSISGLFIAGILPAICISLGLCAMVFALSRRTGVVRPDWPGWMQLVRTTLIAAPGFLVPLVIIAAIESGVATPTEVSAVAVVMCGVFALLYREMGWLQVWQLSTRAASTSGMILLLVGAANAFSWSLTAANLADRIAKLFTGFDSGPLVFMLISIVAFLIMGTLLEGLPAIIVFTPLLFPTAMDLGSEPLQYGILAVIGMGIGSFLPPMGVGLYVAASTMEVSFESAAKAMLPYVAVLVSGVVLVALVPPLTLALPRAMGLTP